MWKKYLFQNINGLIYFGFFCNFGHAFIRVISSSFSLTHQEIPLHLDADMGDSTCLISLAIY